MPKTALFLGAGASRAFDYPTTLEFVDKLRDVLEPLEKSILNSILKSPKVSDIEHVLQTLDPIINPESIDYLQGVLQGSPISMQIFGTEVKWGTFILTCQRLKQSIITELFSQYEFNSTKLDKIIKCFIALDSILCDVNQLKELHVFTTNYDSVFESFCIHCDKQMEFTCGFRTDRRSERHFWHPEELKKWIEARELKELDSTNCMVRLIGVKQQMVELNEYRLKKEFLRGHGDIKEILLFIPHKRTMQLKNLSDDCRDILKVS